MEHEYHAFFCAIAIVGADVEQWHLRHPYSMAQIRVVRPCDRRIDVRQTASLGFQIGVGHIGPRYDAWRAVPLCLPVFRRAKLTPLAG